MPSIVDDAILRDVLKLVLEVERPLQKSTDLLAMACVAAAVRHPGWAESILRSAAADAIELGDRIAAATGLPDQVSRGTA